MNKEQAIITFLIGFTALYLVWQFGRYYGYQEGHYQTLEAIGRSTVEANLGY